MTSSMEHFSVGPKPFVTATVLCMDGDESQWWKILAFPEPVHAELMRLDNGDAVAAQGLLKVEAYEKDGSTKVSLSILCDHVLALRQPPKARKPRQEAGTAENEAAPFDDAVPF